MPDLPVKQLVAMNVDRGIRLRGFTNREVAEKIGKTEHMVWRWRTGKHMPEKATLMALANLLFDGDFTELYRDHPNGDTPA